MIIFHSILLTIFVFFSNAEIELIDINSKTFSTTIFSDNLETFDISNKHVQLAAEEIRKKHEYILKEPNLKSMVKVSHYLTDFSDNHEIWGLLNGELNPRSSCNNITVTTRECKFAYIVAQYNIYPPIPITSLSILQWSYLFDFGDDLFNAQLYEHAEAWTIFLMNYIDPVYSDNNNKDSYNNLPVEQLKFLLRGSTILSEVSKLNGNMLTASAHGFRMLHFYDLLSHKSDPFYANIAVLARLRMILSIPPTPPDFITAMKKRELMIVQLQQLLSDIILHNTTVTLEVILRYL